jgi:hypothetical protein
MKYLLIIATITLILFSCKCKNQVESKDKTVITWPKGLPQYDHILIVMEENKDYSEVLTTDTTSAADSTFLVDHIAPYINKTLRAEGANFTQMYGEEHFSQGNYFWFLSGSNQNIGFNDEVPDRTLTAPNLASQLIEKGYTFKGYAESLPSIGSTEDTDGLYARKHVPWISFINVPNGKTVETSSNLRFIDFPKDTSEYKNLPTVCFVIPNLANDMHNGTDPERITKGDTWLKDNLDNYYQWAKKHNSLLILSFDENNDKRYLTGLTNPMVNPDTCSSDYTENCVDLQNNTITIFAGAHIKAGDYAEGNGITHVTILRTIEAMYGLPKAGAQQTNAVAKGITDNQIITDIFEQNN